MNADIQTRIIRAIENARNITKRHPVTDATISFIENETNGEWNEIFVAGTKTSDCYSAFIPFNMTNDGQNNYVEGQLVKIYHFVDGREENIKVKIEKKNYIVPNFYI